MISTLNQEGITSFKNASQDTIIRTDDSNQLFNKRLVENKTWLIINILDVFAQKKIPISSFWHTTIQTQKRLTKQRIFGCAIVYNLLTDYCLNPSNYISGRWLIDNKSS